MGPFSLSLSASSLAAVRVDCESGWSRPIDPEPEAEAEPDGSNGDWRLICRRAKLERKGLRKS